MAKCDDRTFVLNQTDRHLDSNLGFILAWPKFGVDQCG